MVRKIAVCDDDRDVCRQLSLYLKQLAQESGDELQTLYYASAEELLQFLPSDVQVLLLDISMGQTTGMQAARQLRAQGRRELYILFITNLTEYALEGYDVHAFAFLPKPVQYAALRRYLLDAFSELDQTSSALFTLENGASRQTIRLDELIYAEVYQHETCFHLDSGPCTGKIALSALEKQLAGHGFFRCHKSYLVNLRRIARIDAAQITMDEGSVVPLSKYRRRELLAAYGRCVGGAL